LWGAVRYNALTNTATKAILEYYGKDFLHIDSGRGGLFMGAMTLDLEGWYKNPVSGTPTPIKNIHFRVTEECHLWLEKATEELQRSHQVEKFLDIDPEQLEVKISTDCGPLVNCQLRVYLKLGDDEQCHFHLVGNRQSDNSLAYSNSVLVNFVI